MDCKLELAQGKVIRYASRDKVICFHMGRAASTYRIVIDNAARWKLLADHAGYALSVFVSGDPRYAHTLAEAGTCEIGSDGPSDLSFEGCLDKKVGTAHHVQSQSRSYHSSSTGSPLGGEEMTSQQQARLLIATRCGTV